MDAYEEAVVAWVRTAFRWLALDLLNMVGVLGLLPFLRAIWSGRNSMAISLVGVTCDCPGPTVPPVVLSSPGTSSMRYLKYYYGEMQ